MVRGEDLARSMGVDPDDENDGARFLGAVQRLEEEEAYLRPDRFVEETHLFTLPTKFVRIPSSPTDDRLPCTIRAILSPRVVSAGPEGG